MQYDDRNERAEREDVDELDYLEDGEPSADETLRADEVRPARTRKDGPSERATREREPGNDAESGSPREPGDRTHQAPHEDYVGRADWAVEGSEGGGDPGAPPRRGGSGAGSRRKQNE